jgi:hypothetical protein
MQYALPDLGLNVPAGHDVHDVEPNVENVSNGQAEQAFCRLNPAEGLYVPAGQLRQLHPV